MKDHVKKSKIQVQMGFLIKLHCQKKQTADSGEVAQLVIMCSLVKHITADLINVDWQKENGET